MIRNLLLAAIAQTAFGFGGQDPQLDKCVEDAIKGCTPDPEGAATPTAAPIKTLDVAIIGAGISGTYAAWRLQNEASTKDLNVEIFERSDRVGGRLYSPTIGCTSDNAEEQGHLPRGELGGMRVRVPLDSTLLSLAPMLGIELAGFYLNDYDANPEDQPSNPTWLRGDTYNREQVIKGMEILEAGDLDLAAKTPYAVHENVFLGEKDNKVLLGTPDSKFYNVTQLPADGYNPCSPSNYKILKQELYDLPAADWTEGVLGVGEAGVSSEGLELAMDFGGYHYDVNTAGFTNMQEETNFLPPGQNVIDHYVRPLHGMQSFPLKLNEAFIKGGGITNLNSELIAIKILDQSNAMRKHGKFKLTFQTTRTNPCTEVTELHRDLEANEFEVYVNRVFLAGLPMEELQDLIGSTRDPALKETTKKLVAAVESVEAGKIFLALNDPPPVRDAELKDMPFTTGRFTSSTNLQQVFHWYPGTQSRPENTVPSCKKTVLQAYTNNAFFDSMNQIPAFYECPWAVDADHCNLCPSAKHWANDPRHHFPKNALEEILSNLALTYNQPQEEFNVVENRIQWWSRSNPVTRSEGWHHWKGTDWWNHFETALQPDENLPLHIIGEAFTSSQGWAEGAVTTAEYALQEKMGLPRPAWMEKEDYCKLMPYYPAQRKND